MRFHDRTDAGKKLADALQAYKNNPDVVVLGLPRGGVPVAYEVAKALHAPLDIIVTRKIGAPGHEELALGALGLTGTVVWNTSVMKSFHVVPEDVQEIIEKERAEAQRRSTVYRGNRAPLDLTNKTALIVDDGIATGATMRAAVHEAKALGANKVVVGVPVGTLDSLEALEGEADEIVCVHIPKTLLGISAFYDNFTQTSDQEVIALLNQQTQ